MFKVFPASLQTFIDKPNYVLEDRVQYSTVHIPNVFCDGHLQIINCMGIVDRCTETLWSPCIYDVTGIPGTTMLWEWFVQKQALKQGSLNAGSWKFRLRSIARLERSAERILCPSAFVCPSTSPSHVLLGLQCSVTVVVPDMSCVSYIHEASSYVMFVRQCNVVFNGT